jgi:hypothetical protein
MRYFFTYIFCAVLFSAATAVIAQSDDSTALRLTPNWSYLHPSAPNPNLISGDGADGTNGGGNTATFLRVTAGSVPHSVRFWWQLPEGMTGSAVLLVRKNNQTLLNISVAATDTAWEMVLPTFYTHDKLRVSLRANTVLLNLNATFLYSLAASTVAPSGSNVQPLATIESVHPRRRTLRSAVSAVSTVTPPTLQCNWIRDASTASFLLYRTNDIATCLSATDLEGDAFDACVSTRTAYFTFDNNLYSCNDIGGGSHTGQRGNNPAPTGAEAVFSVAPNPFGQYLLLKYALATATETELTLRNINGETVWQQRNFEAVGDYKLEINTNHLPQGIYFYTFQNGATVQQGRLLKTF